jgi:hypothetical protein
VITIRRGVTRTVLLAGPWAVKIPSLRAYNRGLPGLLWSITRGIQANLSEREWSTSPGVCPVRWSIVGLLNIYPRCTPITHEPTDSEYDAIGFHGPTDRKPHNVGWLAGRLVWVDYDMSWNDCIACRRFGY